MQSDQFGQDRFMQQSQFGQESRMQGALSSAKVYARDIQFGQENATMDSKVIKHNVIEIFSVVCSKISLVKKEACLECRTFQGDQAQRDRDFQRGMQQDQFGQESRMQGAQFGQDRFMLESQQGFQGTQADLDRQLQERQARV